MFGSSILEAAIGLIFIYLLLSLICSVINETIATALNQRGKNLFEGIKNILNDPKFTGLAQQIYTHGLVDGISQEASNPGKPNRLPSYMASRTFALALLDVLASQGVEESWKDIVSQREAALTAAKTKFEASPGDTGLQQIFDEAQAALGKAQWLLQKAGEARQAHDQAKRAAQEVTGPTDFDKLRLASAKLKKALVIGRALAVEFPDPLANIQKAVYNLPEGHTKESLLILIDKTKRETAFVPSEIIAAGHQLERLQENIEQWFNDTMDRVSGWYKRWTQRVVLAISIFLVFAANADTLMLAKRLTRDSALRASIVTAAEQVAQNDAANPAENIQARQELLKVAETLNLPLGWMPGQNDPYATEQVPDSFAGWLLKVPGLLISIFAVSLGAPFWFDTLSKFINLRGAGTPPGESKKSAPQVTKS